MSPPLRYLVFFFQLPSCATSFLIFLLLLFLYVVQVPFAVLIFFRLPQYAVSALVLQSWSFFCCFNQLWHHRQIPSGGLDFFQCCIIFQTFISRCFTLRTSVVAILNEMQWMYRSGLCTAAPFLLWADVFLPPPPRHVGGGEAGTRRL
jgi:hypothetical protein